MYRYVLLLHIVSATIWTGGHLVLALRILPSVLKQRSASMLLGFERRYEPLGMSALVVQVVPAHGWRRVWCRCPSGSRSAIRHRGWW